MSAYLPIEKCVNMPEPSQDSKLYLVRSALMLTYEELFYRHKKMEITRS